MNSAEFSVRDSVQGTTATHGFFLKNPGAPTHDLATLKPLSQGLTLEYEIASHYIVSKATDRRFLSWERTGPTPFMLKHLWIVLLGREAKA